MGGAVGARGWWTGGLLALAVVLVAQAGSSRLEAQDAGRPAAPSGVALSATRGQWYVDTLDRRAQLVVRSRAAVYRITNAKGHPVSIEVKPAPGEGTSAKLRLAPGNSMDVEARELWLALPEETNGVVTGTFEVVREH